jgi:lipoyl(octanoyl) transferase
MTYPVPHRGIEIIEWNLTPYKQAWEKQEALFNSVVEIKMHNRNSEAPIATPNFLVFCEHPPVYTLGKSGSMVNLLLSEDDLVRRSIEFFKINRGGDITFHGPGQLVMYPIFDLENFFTDIHKYLRLLEEAVILMLNDFGIEAGRYEGYTGVWIEPDGANARKICAMGVKCSRWVSMHGIALNVNTDLTYFTHIIPCGIDDKAVTSMQAELGREIDMKDVQSKLQDRVIEVFEGIEIHKKA